MAKNKGYSEKVDIWAAGIIFFTLVTNHHPFEPLMKYNMKDFMNKFMKFDIKNLSFDRQLSKVPYLNSKVMKLILSMLEYDSEKRISSVDYGENFIPVEKEYQLFYTSRNINIEDKKSNYTEGNDETLSKTTNSSEALTLAKFTIYK